MKKKKKTNLSNRVVICPKKNSRFEYYKTPSFNKLYNTKFTTNSKKNLVPSTTEYLRKSEQANGIKKCYS